MAEKQPIFPHITTTTSALMEEVCRAQGCTPSDVVEGALLAYLSPRETSDRDTLVFHKLAHLENDVRSLYPLLEKIVGLLAGLQAPATPRIATYEQLYDDASPAAPEAPDAVSLEDEARQTGGWRRLFPKRTP